VPLPSRACVEWCTILTGEEERAGGSGEQRAALAYAYATSTTHMHKHDAYALGVHCSPFPLTAWARLWCAHKFILTKMELCMHIVPRKLRIANRIAYASGQNSLDSWEKATYVFAFCYI
jgi:hypothetical protein